MTTLTIPQQPPAPASLPLKPFGLGASLLLFGIPAAAMALSVYGLTPVINNLGIAIGDARGLAGMVVMIALLLASLVGYVLEGHPLTWAAFSQRFRLTAIKARDWPWLVGAILVFGIGALLINSLMMVIYQALNFKASSVVMGGQMSLGVSLIVLVFNIIGEEFWWRGFILPRQELAFGKYTWLLHGTLWACFHMYKWFAVPAMLITCQIVPFVAQKTKNTWPGIINHFVVNGVGLLIY
jgi:membrane protease YdiL (CAAX protease family)